MSATAPASAAVSQATVGTKPDHPTRRRLIEVAEQLFAERGIDAVSISEILQAAGQRNKNAVHYHFGDREGLILAIAEDRSEALNRRRSDLLADLRQHDRAKDLRALCSTLVLPLAELLDHEDNHFLGFLARYHLDRSRRRLVACVDPRVTATYRDAARLLRRKCGLSREDFEVRFGLVLDMIFTALAGQQAEERTIGAEAVSRRTAVTGHLIDCAVGSMAAGRQTEDNQTENNMTPQKD
jgi:AcrR family transcriptional regulator